MMTRLCFTPSLSVHFLGLEIPLEGEHCAFGQLVERFRMLVLTPYFHIDESRHALGFIAVGFLTADCQGETGYACIGELADFCVLTYKT